jgi:uncharacterized protein YpmS
MQQEINHLTNSTELNKQKMQTLTAQQDKLEATMNAKLDRLFDKVESTYSFIVAHIIKEKNG